MLYPGIARYGGVERAGIVPNAERTVVANYLEAIEEKMLTIVGGEPHAVAHQASFDVVGIRDEEIEFALDDSHGLRAQRRRRDGSGDFGRVRRVGEHLVQVR